MSADVGLVRLVRSREPAKRRKHGEQFHARVRAELDGRAGGRGRARDNQQEDGRHRLRICRIMGPGQDLLESPPVSKPAKKPASGEKMNAKTRAAVLAAGLSLALPADADEGMWTLDNLPA